MEDQSKAVLRPALQKRENQPRPDGYVLAALFGLVFGLGGQLRALRRKRPRAMHAAAAAVSALAVVGVALVVATAISIIVGVWELRSFYDKLFFNSLYFFKRRPYAVEGKVCDGMAN